MYSHKELLQSKGLKITPQRVAVMDALRSLKSHPTAELVISFVQANHPHIASGTIYKTLELFVQSGIIRKVMTEQGCMRYDSILDKHHHLYFSESGTIEDYFDAELDALLKDYFAKKRIKNFTLREINLQLVGSQRGNTAVKEAGIQTKPKKTKQSNNLKGK